MFRVVVIESKIFRLEITSARHVLEIETRKDSLVDDEILIWNIE